MGPMGGQDSSGAQRSLHDQPLDRPERHCFAQCPRCRMATKAVAAQRQFRQEDLDHPGICQVHGPKRIENHHAAQTLSGMGGQISKCWIEPDRLGAKARIKGDDVRRNGHLRRDRHHLVQGKGGETFAPGDAVIIVTTGNKVRVARAPVGSPSGYAPLPAPQPGSRS